MDLNECLKELKKVRKSMFNLQMKKINGEKGVISEQKKLSAAVRKISKRVGSDLKLQSDKNTSLSTLYSKNLGVLSTLRSHCQDRIRSESKLHLSVSLHGNLDSNVTLFNRREPSVLDNVSKRVVHQNPEIIDAVREKILHEEKKYSEVLGLFEILKREVLSILDMKFKTDLRTMRERELISLYTQEIRNLKRQRANVFERRKGKLVLFDRKKIIRNYDDYLIYDDEEQEMEEKKKNDLISSNYRNPTSEPQRLFEPSKIIPSKNRTRMNQQILNNDKTVLKEILDDLENLTKPTKDETARKRRLDHSRKRASRRSSTRCRKKKQNVKQNTKKKKRIRKSLKNLKKKQDKIIKEHTNRQIVKEYHEDSLLGLDGLSQMEEEEKISEVKSEIQKGKQRVVEEARSRALDRVKEMKKEKKKEEKKKQLELLRKERNKWKNRDRSIKTFLVRKELKRNKKKKKKGRRILRGRKRIY